MLDLDQLINQGFEIKFLEKKVTVKQPTISLVKQIGILEADMRNIAQKEIDYAQGKIKEAPNSEKSYEDRCKITQLILNNNSENIKFSYEDIRDKMPVKLQVALNNEVAKFVYKLNNSKN